MIKRAESATARRYRSGWNQVDCIWISLVFLLRPPSPLGSASQSLSSGRKRPICLAALYLHDHATILLLPTYSTTGSKSDANSLFASIGFLLSDYTIGSFKYAAGIILQPDMP